MQDKTEPMTRDEALNRAAGCLGLAESIEVDSYTQGPHANVSTLTNLAHGWMMLADRLVGA